MNSVDSLVVKRATILDPDGPLREADIRIEDGIIAEVGGSLAGDRTVDAEGMVAMPGLVNAHTHSGQNLDRGVAPNLPLDLWLMWVVYGGAPISADDAYTLAAAGALEMLRSGCTAVLDHAWVPPDEFDEHTDAIMQAYADTGLRAGLAPMIQDRDIFESMSFEAVADAPEPLDDPLDPALLRSAMERFFDRWEGANPRLTPMVGPSAPQRCSDELMTEMADLARTRGALFHTHVLETRTQISATLERYGRSSVDFLDELGLLSPRSSLAHCVWMTGDEYSKLRETGTTVVHNPVSNLRCGSGLLPLADLLEADVSVALGADGAASNDNQNMLEAIKLAMLIHTLYGHHSRWPDAFALWSACIRAGAAALGRPPGAIRAGAPADVVLLDTSRHVVVERESLVRSLVLADHGQSVHTVIVDGEIVVEDRRPTRVDDADINRRALAYQRRIHEWLPQRQAVYDRYVDVLTAVHDHAEAAPVPIERRASITPAFDRT